MSSSSLEPIEKAKTHDLRDALPALQRAAQRARQLAAQTGTALVVVRCGVLAHIHPADVSLGERTPADTPQA
jgi:hypothetical protein